MATITSDEIPESMTAAPRLFQLDIYCDLYEDVMNKFYPTLSGLIYDVQIKRVDVADNYSMNKIDSEDTPCFSWKIPEKSKLLWYGTTPGQFEHILENGLLANFNNTIVLTDKICGAIHYTLKRKRNKKCELVQYPYVFLLCNVNLGNLEERTYNGPLSFDKPGWGCDTRRVNGKPWWCLYPGNVEDAQLCDHYILGKKTMAEIKFVVYTDLFVLE